MDYLLSPDFIAGCIAGSFGIIATQPMDTIRIRMQVNQSLMSNASVRTHFLKVCTSSKYSNSCFFSVFFDKILAQSTCKPQTFAKQTHTRTRTIKNTKNN